MSTLKASTIQFDVTNILTNSAPLSSRGVKLRYEECLQNWGNANELLSVLETVKKCVEAGELDAQIDAASNAVRARFVK